NRRRVLGAGAKDGRRVSEEYVGENLEALARLLRIREYHTALVIVDFGMAVGQHLDAVLRSVFLGRFDPRLRQIAIPCPADVDFDVLRYLPLVLAFEQFGHPERQKLLVLL